MWVAFGSVGVIVLTVFATPFLVVLIPCHYFQERVAPPSPWLEKRPNLRFCLKVLRNIVAVGLLITGIAFLALPGPGFLTLLAAAILSDFRGKRKFEIWLAKKPSVLRSINWIRQKAGREKIKAP